MADDPHTPDDRTTLPLPTRASDRIVSGRTNDLYRHALPTFIGHNSDRKICVPPTASDFSTWVNQDTATITDVDDGCYLTRAAKGSGDSLHCRVRSLVGSAWDVRVGVICGYAMKQYFGTGLVLRESATGKLNSWQLGHGDAGGPLNVWWNSPTSFQQTRYNPSSQAGSSLNKLWFRVRKNGSTLEYYTSPDGSDWTLDTTEAATGLWTSAPNQWGIFINTNNNATPNLVVRADFIDWAE